MRTLYTAIMAYLGFLAFAPAAGLAKDIKKIEEDYSRTAESSGIAESKFQTLFPIDKERNILYIQDWFIIDDKRKIEIIQGDERKRFEPIQTIEIENIINNTPLSILKAKRDAYGMGLDFAMNGYKREGEKPPLPDGFYIEFSFSNGEAPEEQILTTIITLCKELKKK